MPIILRGTYDPNRYLNTDEAAHYARRPSREAFRKWAQRHGIELLKPEGGRAILVRRTDIDAVLLRLKRGLSRIA